MDSRRGYRRALPSIGVSALHDQEEERHCNGPPRCSALGRTLNARDNYRAIEQAPAQIPPRLFIFARHAESTANTSGVVSSDPHRPVALTHRGREQARELGAQVAGLDIELAVATRFQRTQETAALALAARPVPVLIEPGLDELQAGDLDGSPLQDYWAWKENHTSADRFPNGESVDEARIRYATALWRLLSRTERVTLIILHELALRWIGETATGWPFLPNAAFGNAMPYLFEAHAVVRAAARLEDGQARRARSRVGGEPVGDTIKTVRSRTCLVLRSKFAGLRIGEPQSALSRSRHRSCE